MRKSFRVTLSIIAISCFLILASCGSKVQDNTSTNEVNIENSETSLQDESLNTDSTAESKDEGNLDGIASDEVVDESEDSKEQIMPSLRDNLQDFVGERIGCAVTGSEIDDEKVWEIITTHFNAVTLGNELKPDCMFGYSNGKVPGKETVVFNGEEMVVPKLDYSRANRLLNKFVEWNENNPDRKIQVRGHVLVWHSQTPEWFFHEDYDKNNAYVSKEEMNKRLEWYISSILTYYTGEDSKYKDLFYGWDVVNEAVSDRGGLRTDNENSNESLSSDTHGSNSSWWHIYESNEYIINAFKFANKYAPESLELYYNDYNETQDAKQKSIVELLTAIKDAEGEPGVGTRISAMGMQGHYGIDSSNPSGSSVKLAMKAYCKVVGTVQFTELDLKINDSYENTDEGIEEINKKLKSRYSGIVFEIKSALMQDYVHLGGMTFWGTVDHYSWLQSRSNVGGGNTNSIKQMPLLFDSDYEAKPCFYVFAKSE